MVDDGAHRAPINDVVDGGTKRLKLVATRSLADHQRNRIPVCECFQQLLLVVKGPLQRDTQHGTQS